MGRFVAVVVLAAVLVPAAQAKLTDPRKCVLNNPKACANEAAKVALRRAISARTGHPGTLIWDADISCTPRNAKLLLWGCTWKGAGGTYGTGSATVTFTATQTGWHVAVTAIKTG